MEQKKEDITKQADKNAIERMLNELSEPKPYGRTTKEMYHQHKFPNIAEQEKFQKYRNEELKKLEENQKGSSRNSELENLKNQLEQKTKTIEELTDTLKRLQAEFENYRKRVDKEKTEFAKYAHAGIIAKILPVLDSFEMALKHTNEPQKFINGMKLIYAQLHSALEADGLRPIKTDGEKFDPYKHEVLMKEESDKPEGTILEEFQKGYMLNDKVLRFSKVKISAENKK